MSADAVRGLVARQRVRNRIFTVVAAAAALLNAGIIVMLVAAATRAVAAVVGAAIAVAVMAAVSLGQAVMSAGRPRGEPPDAETGAMLGPAAARLAARLGIEQPELRIADEDAVNAFSVSPGRQATLFFTRGFLDEFGRADDGPLIEAVTAHLLARAAAGDNALTITSGGLLNWALFLFHKVVRGFARVLRMLGVGYLTSDAHQHIKPAGNVYGDDGVNRLIVWGISVFLGLCLLLAAAGVMLAGGILMLVAGGVRLGLTRQRIRIADAVAGGLVDDPRALLAAFARFSDIGSHGAGRIELARGGETRRDLCFDRPSRWYPGLPARAASVAGSDGTAQSGILAPAAGAFAVACMIAGVGLVVARVPYGQPFGGAGPQVPQAQAAPVSAVSGRTPGTQVTPLASVPPQSQPSPSLSSPTPAPSPAARTVSSPTPSATSSPTARATSSPTPSATSSPTARATSSPTAGGTSTPTPSVPPATVCQPDGTGCTRAGRYRDPHALINGDYAGFKVTWSSTYVQPYSSGVPLYWTVGVTYRNVDSATLTLGCPGNWPNASFVQEYMSGGAGDDGMVPAGSTTCSEYPGWTMTVPPGASVVVHATFHNVPWPGSAVAVRWGDAGTSAYIYPFS